MTRFIAFLYGLVAYFVFFGTILYAIGFVTGLVVPKTIDTGTVVPLTEALIVNLLLMSLFAVQHSVMARPAVQGVVDAIRAEVGRAQHLCAAREPRARAAVLAVAADPGGGLAGRRSARSPRRSSALSLFGWVLVFTSTFLINHFELFGLHQVANNLAGRPMPQVRFKTPMLYKFVRHPIYLGFIIAFWAAPTMTAGTAVRRGDHGLHLRRHLARGARPDRDVRRRIPPLPRAGVDAGALAQIGLTRAECHVASIRTAPALCRRRLRSANLPRWQAETSAPARRDPKAIEAAVRALAARFGNRARDLAGGARAARQHRHLDREPAAGRGGVSAIDRGRAGDRAHLRGASRAGHPVRHRHLARRPRQRAARRRLDRRPRHEPGARGARRGPRLRGRAGRHPQGAQRISARPGPVLPDRSGRRRLARRHGGDALLGHQRGALRHHEGQRAVAQSRDGRTAS